MCILTNQNNLPTCAVNPNSTHKTKTVGLEMVIQACFNMSIFKYCKSFHNSNKRTKMSNELVTMPNGTEVVSMAVTVTNMSATTNQNDYAETLNVAAEYITAIKWQEGGTKSPIPFYGKYLGFIDVQKIDTVTGELKIIKTAQLMGGFSENGVIKNAFYVAAQATLVGALEQLFR
jgi:hypothetical protein